LRIGVVGAMSEEIALLRNGLENPQVQTRGMRDYWQGSLFGRSVVLAFSRWGKVASASTVTTLIESFEVDLVVFTGVAGALAPDLDIGDIVIAESLMQHDMDASALPGIKPFEIPLLGVENFPIKKRLVDLATESARRYLTEDLPNDVPSELLHEFGIVQPKVCTGLIITQDQVVGSTEAQSKIKRAIPAALCVEMEGAAVAQVCYEHDVPVAVVRAISDKADHSAVINFPRFVDKVASHFTCGIVREFIAQT